MEINEISDRAMTLTDSINIQTAILRTYCERHINDKDSLDVIHTHLDSISDKLNQLMILMAQI